MSSRIERGEMEWPGSALSAQCLAAPGQQADGREARGPGDMGPSWEGSAAKSLGRGGKPCWLQVSHCPMPEASVTTGGCKAVKALTSFAVPLQVLGQVNLPSEVRLSTPGLSCVRRRGCPQRQPPEDLWQPDPGTVHLELS